MRRTLAVVLLVLAPVSARAEIVVQVFASVAPNVLESPSAAGFRANVLAGLAAGGLATGTPDTPELFEPVPNGGTIAPADLFTTDFPLWRGTLDPAAPYDGEFGNRVQFSMLAFGTAGELISLNAVRYSATDTLDGSLSVGGTFVGSNYNANRVGVIYGPGGPTFVTSGSSTQLVNEIRLVGFGTWFPLAAGDFGGGPTQPDIDAAANLPAFTLTGRYEVELLEGTFAAATTLNVTNGPPPAVPAPAGLVLGGVAVLIGFGRRSGRGSRVAGSVGS